MRRALHFFAALFALGAGAHAASPDPAKLAFFESKIRPVLVEHCYRCHSAEAKEKGKLKGGLYVDSRQALLTGGDTGPAVVPGKPSESLLLQAMQHVSSDLAMPPKEPKLAAGVLEDFARWIRDGAFDPREGTAPEAKKRGLTIAEGRAFWSFIPPKATLGPSARADIDALVAKHRAAQGLSPAGHADPAALLRRLSFDLTGLPPAPEEIDAFTKAYGAAPDAALEALVARLLASPHFGERWGRHWLDAARYADSNGRDRNVMNYHAWRYRDYVIAAFHRDKPYDQFIREQIAGDLLPARDPAERDEHRIATGFLALGAKAFEESKPEVFRMDVIDEQIETVGRSVLGLSVACARCHDHKFDPIPTADYYALAGIFRSTQLLYGWGPRGIKATAHHHTEWQPIGPDAERLAPAALEYYRRLDAEILAMHTARSDRYRVVRRVSSARLELAKPGADREKLQAEITAMEAEIKNEWDPKIRALEEAVDALKDAAPPEPGWAMAARERPQPEDCRIHVRGETTHLGPTVRRGVLQVISLPQVQPPAPAESGRLQLAHWLTARENPLTARVYVNRVWQKLFGRGLVTTPDDFGVGGAKPSHPELLDYLAVAFMDGGWSVKRLLRELVLTRTYRLSSDAIPANLERDPDNIYLWRMAPRALEAEALRDSILAASGQLELTPPAKQFLDRLHPRRDAELMSFKPFLDPAAIRDTHRSVYLPVVRGALPEIYSLFDFAPPERPVAQREESILPAQALYLMNNGWVIEQAAYTARRLLAQPHASDGERIAQLYRLVFARRPTPEELARAEQFLAGTDELLPVSTATSPAESRWTSLCQTIFAAAEFRLLR